MLIERHSITIESIQRVQFWRRMLRASLFENGGLSSSVEEGVGLETQIMHLG
jgi:hypothetical protein